MEERFMLTTFDNPYNPFVNFSEWYMFDCASGHNTCARLARLTKDDNEMTQKEIEEDRNRAIDSILKYDFIGEYFKGTKQQIEKWLQVSKNIKKVIGNEETADEKENMQTATAKNA